MPIAYLDTNIFIRFITKDQPEQAKRAYRLFKEVEEGRQQVTTVEMVIAEIVHVLSSPKLYVVPRQEIKLKLNTILSLKGFVLPQKRTVRRGLEIYASTNLDFVDAYLVAVAERVNQPVISFDEGIGKISSVTRHEP